MIRRPLWTLPISEALITKLKDAGYEFVEDVLCDANKKELKQLIPDGVDFQSLIRPPPSYSAAELFKMESKKIGGIVTFSKAIDDLFKCGIPTSKITEIVGAPGTGKTQLCLQLCVSVQMPDFIGGISGSAIYISTNNNFSFKRIKEIYDSCASHCIKIAGDVKSLSGNEKKTFMNFIQNDPLYQITRFNVETIEQLRACIFYLQKQLETSETNIRLLIIDSFTFPFYSIEANLERTRRISTLQNQLNQMAATHQLAVVLINELTTCVSDNGFKEVIPSLGETFAHNVHNRLVLSERNNEGYYTALLAKSSESPSGTAFFQITDGGIRDVPAK